MFNDEPFRLTEAVMSGRKTTARFLVPPSQLKAYETYCAEHPKEHITIRKFLLGRGLSKYLPYEEVAIAQSYSSLGLAPDLIQRAKSHDKKTHRYVPISELEGWKNKMYVSSDFMPHSILITDVRVERLQSITDDDARKEGIMPIAVGGYGTYASAPTSLGPTPRKAYAKLIDELCKKRVWDKHPWVYVYEFRFMK